MMNKELERLIASIQVVKQIFQDLELNVNAEIEYKDGSKETINVYDIIENQIVKDINSHDSQLTAEEIDALFCYFAKSIGALSDDLLKILKIAYTVGENDLDSCISAVQKLQKQKEMLEDE